MFWAMHEDVAMTVVATCNAAEAKMPIPESLTLEATRTTVLHDDDETDEMIHENCHEKMPMVMARTL